MSIGIHTNYKESSYVTNNTSGEKVKTSRNVDDYAEYLQDKYSYMNKTTSMEGIPTTVSVSPAFLKKCAEDPEKAKFLEENLNAIPDCAKMAVAGCLGTLTNLDYNIDANGNISIAISGTSDPDGKIAKENAERKAKEKKEKEEKAANRRAEKRDKEEKIAKQHTEKSQTGNHAEKSDTNEISISVTGSSVKSVTQSVVLAISSNTIPTASGFDAKA